MSSGCSHPRRPHPTRRIAAQWIAWRRREDFTGTLRDQAGSRTDGVRASTRSRNELNARVAYRALYACGRRQRFSRSAPFPDSEAPGRERMPQPPNRSRQSAKPRTITPTSRPSPKQAARRRPPSSSSCRTSPGNRSTSRSTPPPSECPCEPRPHATQDSVPASCTSCTGDPAATTCRCHDTPFLHAVHVHGPGDASAYEPEPCSEHISVEDLFLERGTRLPSTGGTGARTSPPPSSAASVRRLLGI